jgi:putative transcriptional regulator
MKSQLNVRAKSIEAMQQVIAYRGGKTEGFKTVTITPPQVNVKVIRERLNMTQQEFAEAYGLSLSTLKNWEQGHRQPDGVVRIFIKMIENDPPRLRKQVQAALAA